MEEVHGQRELPQPYSAIYHNWGEDPYGGGWHSWKAGYRYDRIVKQRRPGPRSGLNRCVSRSPGFQDTGLGSAVWSKNVGQSAPRVPVEHQQTGQVEVYLGLVEPFPELADRRLECFGRDRADVVVGGDQAVLVGNLQLVEKGAEQFLATAEVQGQEQRGRQPLTD